ncbi:LD-carboxypeptidase [Halobacillus yeomjeoni]|uniref:S66 peptidase family protein n=1 Tax=Halobacillus yeomjeoni TaxID=311194 RepID=UPI001CD42733|nr:LD-carboxypeptidase [Halobacillus yeomjeoni]MCA0983366.1 LD-carboxypeptidase [Halobacillus yeomjeoni]
MVEGLIKPERLHEGDCVGIIAPAGPADEKELFIGLEKLKQMKLIPVLGRNLFQKKRYLAGKDEARLEDLHAMFLDPAIKAIICARGGYGTARLAPYLDYSMIRCNPKVFWGYSDITYLHTAIQMYSGLVTFHAPMVASDLGKNDCKLETFYTFNQLFYPHANLFNRSNSSIEVIKSGCGSGRITGGNLTLLTDSLGTDFEISTSGRILFFEEVNEPAYRIDAMLTHMKWAGKFENVCGVVIGDIKAGKGESEKIRELLYEFFCNAPFPVVRGLEIGHCQPNYGIPLGVQAHLDTDLISLMIEPGVE